MEYLHRHNFKERQRNKLTSKLKQLNGEPYFFNIKGKGVNVAHELNLNKMGHDLRV